MERKPSSYDVFLSHAHEDREWAERICRTAEESGMRCWIAPRDVRPGADYGTAIIDAVGRSSSMLVVLSSASNASQHVRREVERAVSRDIPILPVRIEDVVPSKGLEYHLSTAQWLDALEGPTDDALEQIATTVRDIVHRRDATPMRERPIARAPRPKPRSKSKVRVASLGVLLVAGIAAIWFYGGNPFSSSQKHPNDPPSDHPDEPPNESRELTAAGFPGTVEGAKGLIRTLTDKTGDERRRFLQTLRPAAKDFDAIFDSHAAPIAQAHFEEVWKQLPDRVGELTPKEAAHTEIVVLGATTDEIRSSSAGDGTSIGNVGKFPGGYRKIAGFFRPGLLFVNWVMAKPGSTSGSKYQGLVHANGRWIFLPKIYDALDDPPATSEGAWVVVRKLLHPDRTWAKFQLESMKASREDLQAVFADEAMVAKAEAWCARFDGFWPEFDSEFRELAGLATDVEIWSITCEEMRAGKTIPHLSRYEQIADRLKPDVVLFTAMCSKGRTRKEIDVLVRCPRGWRWLPEVSKLR